MTRFAALALLACAALPRPAAAWNKAGHMVTGAIAYRALKAQDPDAVPRVVALLKQHPAYAEEWKKQSEKFKLSADEADEYLFMMAGRWCDDSRDDERYYPKGAGLDKWHYINIPYVLEGSPPTVQVGKPEPEMNILNGFDRNLGWVKDQKLDPAKRAVALTWVMHLVGDIHMPLHTTSFFSTKFQLVNGILEGDRGGTRFYVKVGPSGEPISLHYFWDGAVLGSDRIDDARNRAVGLLNRPEYAKEKLSELAADGFSKWAKDESLKLAKEKVYLGGKLQGSPTKDGAVELPEGYTKAAQAVAERRVILSGYRMAAVLAAALPKPAE